MKDISVIIPCYNCASLIGETLDSLLRQSFQNFEVICINDGSTDETLSVLTKWKNRAVLDIKIINQKNAGVSSARNAGIKIATGEYILFLDSDDLYHPDFIERLINAIKENAVDVAYCRLSRDYAIFVNPIQNVKHIKQNQHEAMNNLLYRMPDFGFYCYLYRRARLEKENLLFDVDICRFEDREFNWKYLCHCNSAVLVDIPLYYYRVNKQSVTQSRTFQWRVDGIEAVHRIERYMAERQCPFLPELKSYLYPRVMWSMAKNYCLAGEKELFKRLIHKYDVKTCMKRTAKDKSKLVALASWMFLIHPMLFYYIVRLKK